jgi:hypothetical protein
VIVFGIAGIWSYSAMPRLKTVNDLPVKSAQKSKTSVPVSEKKTNITDDGTKLNIGLLGNDYPEFKGYRRNIFKPLFLDEIKILKQKAGAIRPAQSKVVVSQSSTASTVSTVSPALIQPEAVQLARFTFLGFLKKGAVRTIFLANDKEILLVKKGDIVAKKYEATEISDQQLTLTVSDTGDEIVIPLVENKPLATVK